MRSNMPGDATSEGCVITPAIIAKIHLIAQKQWKSVKYFSKGDKMQEQWIVPCSFHSDYSKNLLNRLENVGKCKLFLYVGEGKYQQWIGKADNHEILRDKSEKLLIRCNTMNIVNVEW